MTSDCWVWTAARTTDGYGCFKDGPKQVMAHRFAYEQVIGPIPDGHQIDHLCRNPSCVRPEHLEPVTPRENTLRGTGPSAVHARKTHCIHGHEFTDANTYMHDGQRKCRACQKTAHERLKRRRSAIRLARRLSA
jgi:hypothetical protein